MSKIDVIYGPQVLKSYGESYPEEVSRYDTALGIGLVAVVGITAVAATVIVADSLMNNHGYNNAYSGQQQYEQGYNQGYYQGGNQENNYGNNNNNSQQGYGNAYGNSGDQNPDTAEGDY
jgi:hypothetical protein